MRQMTRKGYGEVGRSEPILPRLRQGQTEQGSDRDSSLQASFTRQRPGLMARGPYFSPLRADRHLQTVGDAPGAVDEDRGGKSGQRLAGRAFEQVDPAVKMLAF